ncbi:LysR family transcriptional regulator substrate-binding protein [Nocardia gipuzkoensis]
MSGSNGVYTKRPTPIAAARPDAAATAGARPRRGYGQRCSPLDRTRPSAHSGNAFCARCIRSTLPRHLASRIIATERRVLAVAAHSPLAGATDLSWSDLADRPLVVNTVSGTTDAASWHPAAPDRVVITCTNFDEWIELVAADRGIGVVPDLARTRAPHPGVVYLDISDAPPSHVYVAWRARPVPSRSVQRFLAAL